MTDDDLDLLADYAAGLLGGSAAARVGHRIDTDPEWAEAYAVLSAGTPEVTSALAGLADPPLPTHVADRFRAAIAAQADAAPPTGRVRGTPTDDRAPRARDDTRTPAGRTDAVRPDRRGRWRRILAAAGGGVAVLVAFVIGITVVRGLSHGNQYTADSRKAGPGMAAAPSAAALSGMPRREQTGTDYTATTLGSVFRTPAGGRSNADARAQGGEPADLDRLAVTSALSACLGTVTTEYGGTVSVVDYARYQGRDALIVGLSTGRVVVSGPNCGLPGSGTDLIYTNVP